MKMSNTYISLGNKGDVFFTVAFIRLEQKSTQSSDGGMTDAYLEGGTYVKSFYSVMYQPSSVTVRLMGVSNKRLHHSVKWKYTIPQIIEERYKKQ